MTTGESLPSETLIAWTDPAFPAFVEAPTIHPINMVTEVGCVSANPLILKSKIREAS